MNLLSLALLTLALSGCADPGGTGGTPKDSGESPADVDVDGYADAAAGGEDCDDTDGDGYADAAVGGEDCDDSEPRINPAADDALTPDRNCGGVVSVGALSDA